MANFNANGVPELDLSDSSLEYVREQHQAYLDSDGDSQYLLTGKRVYVHNLRPIGADNPDVTVFRIGGETLDEALKTVVGTFDSFHGLQAPDWVASTDENLGHLLAEHYNCEVKTLDEELAP